MAAMNIETSPNQEDEDYIDMEVSSSSSSSSYSSSSTFFSLPSPTSPPQSREFEFQMSSSISQQKETTPSPADELFYKGKLLPLHLPPRIQMVEKLCQNTKKLKPFQEEEEGEAHFITISTTPSTSTTTPLASCNISPSESCRVSTELNPDDYFYEWSTEFRGFITDHPKKSWSKKLKQIKHLSLSQKLRASRTYLKSLFSKSGCNSDDQACTKPAAAACNIEVAQVGQTVSDGDNDLLSKCINVIKKNPIDQIGKGKYPPTLANVMKSIEKDEFEDNLLDHTSHRKSFSGAIKRHSSRTKLLSCSGTSSSSSSSSSSFSFNSTGFYELQFFKRSCSANSELEGSIEAAIAHCKNSQHIFTRNGLQESGLCSQDSREAKCF